MIFRLDSVFRAVATSWRLAYARFFGWDTLSTPAETEDRLDICNRCEELTEDRQCRVCTCFVDAKTMLTTEKCPKNKWFRIWRRRVA